MQPKYTVIIQWSEEDKSYVASLPEWGPYCKAYGDSYEDAAARATEVLELLMDKTNDPDPTNPEPKLFEYPGADVIQMSEESRAPLRLRRVS